MPPRSRKRKASFGGRRPFKRRRGTVRRGGSYVRAGRRGGQRYGRRRTRMFRRFKKRFNRRRRSRKSRGLTKRKIEFKLAELRSASYSFGQQANVPNDLIDPECRYFTTQQTNTAHTHLNQIITRPLQGIADVLDICNYAWVNTPRNETAGIGLGWDNDIAWGSVYIRGTDQYYLRNQSNEAVRVTAYTCTCRQDTQFKKVAGSGGAPVVNFNNNIYNYLGTGFAENGLAINDQTGTNTYMTLDNFTPYNSRLFCRTFKINRVQPMVIGPGSVRTIPLKTRWRRHIPADYTLNTGAASVWTSRERTYDNLRGERFILFKLHGNIGGVDTQITLEKNIGQTTPTVILKTVRKYQFKHMPHVRGSAVDFVPYGMSQNTASIIIDEDEKKGAEVDAS